MQLHLTHIARRASVGARLVAADAGAALTARATALVDRSEHGAQAAEYAMLGGVSAAACSGLVAILKNKDTLRSLVDAVIGTLSSVIEGWF